MSCCSRAVTSRPPASSSAISSASAVIVSTFFTKPVSYISSTFPKRCLSSAMALERSRGSTSGLFSSMSSLLGALTSKLDETTMFDLGLTCIFSLRICSLAGRESVRSSLRSSAAGGDSFLSSSSCTRDCSFESAITAPLPASPAAFACCRLASSSCSRASSTLPCRARPAILPSITTGVGDERIDLRVSVATSIRLRISALTASLIVASRSRSSSLSSFRRASSCCKKA
mmetsp:Transcript_28364/g.62096  ORF Transcript_28364/g.62096 Transcript_28364/m.62096 type:complete len:230 (+) Transcript_28364:307-996(+)